MKTQAKNLYRAHAVTVLQKRMSRSKFWGWGIFVTMSIAFGVSSVLLVNIIRFGRMNLLLVSKQPLLLPVLINAVMVSLYLALLASLDVTREYTSGTLETLMAGPVDEFSFLAGIMAAMMKVFLVTLLMALVWAYFCAWALNFSINLDIAGLLFTTLFMAGEIIAFGLLTAVWGGKRKHALVYFIMIVLFVGGVQLADFIVAGMVQFGGAKSAGSLIYLRNVLETIYRLLRWVSPYSQVRTAMQAFLDRRVLAFLFSMGSMALEAVVFFAGSVLILKRKGTRGTR